MSVVVFFYVTCMHAHANLTVEEDLEKMARAMCSCCSEKVLENDQSYGKGKRLLEAGQCFKYTAVSAEQARGCVSKKKKKFFLKFTSNKNEDKALLFRIDVN